jgi:glycosyltransferase involved in cell wall biosynthesis
MGLSRKAQLLSGGMDSRDDSRAFADEPNGRSLHLCIVLPPIEPYSPGGGAIATIVRNMALVWGSQGHRVTILAPPDEHTPYQEGHYVAIHVPTPLASRVPMEIGKRLVGRAGSVVGGLRRWDWHRYGSYLGAVKKALASLDGPFDVVIAHNDLQLLGALGPRPEGERSVLWLHNTVRTHRTDGGRLLASADAIVAVSRFVGSWTEREYDLPAGSVRTVHNGVDLERFHPSTTHGQPSSPVRVLCHGRLDPSKGFHLAVDAVRLLRNAGRDVTITLAGGSQAFGISAAEAQHYRDTLLESVAAAGGTYLGRVAPDDMAELLRHHAIACAPSLFEDPFPLSVLEALASGCAVVASRRGGLPEMCDDAATLFDPDEEGALESALATLVDNPEFRQQAQVAARERASAFPWSATAAGILDACGLGRAKS